MECKGSLKNHQSVVNDTIWFSNVAFFTSLAFSLCDSWPDLHCHNHVIEILGKIQSFAAIFKVQKQMSSTCLTDPQKWRADVNRAINYWRCKSSQARNCITFLSTSVTAAHAVRWKQNFSKTPWRCLHLQFHVDKFFLWWNSVMGLSVSCVTLKDSVWAFSCV